MTAPDAWRRFETRPIFRLGEHFFRSLFRTGAGSGGAGVELSISGILAILAVPGAFLSLMLFGKYSSLLRYIRGGRVFDVYEASLPEKYFFIAFSMAITGMVAVLAWDRILPSRDDYFNFAPLPLPLPRIFLANLAAILAAAGLFAADVNIASSILYPAVATADPAMEASYLSFAGPHAASVVLASLFAFFLCFAVVGALMSLLPWRWFPRASLLARVTLMLGFLALLTTSFAVQPLVRRMPSRAGMWIGWLPPVWFLGLYQSLQGRGGAEWVPLASTGLRATAGAAALALLFYVLSYRRYFVRIPETLDAHPETGGRRRWDAVKAILHRYALRTPFQRACYHFALQTLLRSQMHCLLVGAFAGLGIVTASQRALGAGEAALLAPPLIFAYWLIAGLRFAMELPVGLRANLVFRAGLDPNTHEVGAVARKLMWTFVAPAVLLPTLLLYGSRHTVFVAAAAWMLMEVLLLRFRKIPFTCSMPPFREDSVMRLLFYLLGFAVFAVLLPEVAVRISHGGIASWAIVPLAMAATWALVARDRGNLDLDSYLIYEDHTEAAVTVIRLAE